MDSNGRDPTSSPNDLLLPDETMDFYLVPLIFYFFMLLLCTANTSNTDEMENDDDNDDNEPPLPTPPSVPPPPNGNDLVLPDEIIYEILTYFNFQTLVQNMQVSHTWKKHCTNLIDARPRRQFKTRSELYKAAWDYYIGKRDNRKGRVRQTLMYGYPIGKWDVSLITDFHDIFSGCHTFNEDISEWDVSKATMMFGMFRDAKRFNCDLSSWNISNVTRMDAMFYGATAFRQDIISLWGTTDTVYRSRTYEPNMLIAARTLAEAAAASVAAQRMLQEEDDE